MEKVITLKQYIKEPTWIIHGVVGGPYGNVVYHTHGLDKLDSLELELNLPLNQQQAMGFINIIGYAIANGRKLKNNDIIEDLFSCKVFIKEVEGIYGEGEKNLRIVFPDPNFKFPWEDGCEEPYKSQI